MLSAFKQGRRLIIQDDLDAFFDRLESHQLDAIYCDMYECLIKEKNQRKEIIHIAATIKSETVNVEDIIVVNSAWEKRTVQRELNALTKNQQGHLPILVKIRPNRYRFVDPLFKTYCRLVYYNEKRKS